VFKNLLTSTVGLRNHFHIARPTTANIQKLHQLSRMWKNKNISIGSPFRTQEILAVTGIEIAFRLKLETNLIQCRITLKLTVTATIIALKLQISFWHRTR